MKHTNIKLTFQEVVKFMIDNNVYANSSIIHAKGYVILESTLKVQKQALAFFGNAAKAA